MRQPRVLQNRNRCATGGQRVDFERGVCTFAYMLKLNLVLCLFSLAACAAEVTIPGDEPKAAGRGPGEPGDGGGGQAPQREAPPEPEAPAGVCTPGQQCPPIPGPFVCCYDVTGYPRCMRKEDCP